MNIIAFKLTSGEEVVSELIEENDDHFRLGKPRTILLQPGQNGQMNLALVPWMVSAQDPSTNEEGDSIIYKSNIMGKPLVVPAALEKGYMKNTSSIQLL